MYGADELSQPPDSEAHICGTLFGRCIGAGLDAEGAQRPLC